MKQFNKSIRKWSLRDYRNIITNWSWYIYSTNNKGEDVFIVAKNDEVCGMLLKYTTKAISNNDIICDNDIKDKEFYLS